MKTAAPILFFAAAMLSQAADAPTNGVNAAQIYTPVFSNITAWSTAHPGFGTEPYTNVSSPEAAAAFKDLQPQLDALGAAQSAAYCDWGTHHEEGISAQLPYVSPAMKSAKAGLWAANYALSNNLPDFADYAMEAARVARNVGEDRLLIDLLVQIAGEKAAADLLAQNIGKLDAKQLDALEQNLQSLPPGTSLIEAMQMEKAMFIDNLIKQVLKAMREADTNLFEQISDDVSATNTVTDRTNSIAATAAAGAAKKSWLTENLRLTSIVDSGGSYKIGFETRDGDSFVIALGRPKRGIEMLSADYAREEAVIARSNETAIVKLKSREISPLRLRLRMPSPEQAKKLMGSPPSANAVQQLMLAFAAMGDSSDKEDRNIFNACGGTADGLMALLNKTSAEYGEWIAAFQRLPLDEFRKWQNDFLKTTTQLTRLMLPAVDKCADKEKQLLDSRTKLAAAIAARRAALTK